MNKYQRYYEKNKSNYKDYYINNKEQKREYQNLYSTINKKSKDNKAICSINDNTITVSFN
jgi:hypothetical protein